MAISNDPYGAAYKISSHYSLLKENALYWIYALLHQSLVTNGWGPCLISEYYILYFHFLFQVSHFHFLLFYSTAPELGNKWLEPMLNIRVYCSSLPFMSLYNGFSRRLKQFIVIHFKFPMTDKIPIIGGKQVKFQLFDFMAERWTSCQGDMCLPKMISQMLQIQSCFKI